MEFMRTFYPFLCSFLLSGFIAWAEDVEQIEDISIHTHAGTTAAATVLKIGQGFGSGDGVALVRWDEADAGFAGPISEAVGNFRAIGGDGSISIHQMLVDWDESTDYGSILPIAGLDYIPQALAAVGFNETQREDNADLTELVTYWRKNPSQNFGIILVPRGQLNNNYPGSFDSELLIASRERTVGLGSGDSRIRTSAGTLTHLDQVVEPMEDAYIGSSTPNTIYRDSATMGGGVSGSDWGYVLYKFGLGKVRIKDPHGTASFTAVNFLVRSIAAVDPVVTFNVSRMLVNWDEATVTWNQFGGSGPQPGTHYASTTLGSLTLGNGVDAAAVDILSAVEDWYHNPSTNFGLILIPLGGTSSTHPLVASERVFPILDVDDTRLTFSYTMPPTLAINDAYVADVMALQFTSVADTEYVLEYSADGGDVWQSTGLAISGDGGDHTVFDPSGPDAAKTYRLNFLGSPPSPSGGHVPATFVDKTSSLFAGASGLGEAVSCFVDFDLDGWTDICDGAEIQRNRNGTSFTRFASVIGGRTWGDFNNDGYPDLAVPRKPESATGLPPGVMRNLSGGGFSFVALPAPNPVPSSRGSCWGDWNLDLYDDLFVSGYEWPGGGATQTDVRYHSTAGTGFNQAWTETVYRPRGVTACDWDMDGDLDIYTSNYRLQPNRLWENSGNGTFTDVGPGKGASGSGGSAHTVGSAWGDLDNDGLFDLFVGNFAHSGQPQSQFLRNRGPSESYRFEDMSSSAGLHYQESYASPALGDYDNDGDLDLFLTTVYGGDQPVFYKNEGGWSFVDATVSVGLGGLPATYSAAFADIDNDGDLDIATAGRMFVNQGAGNNWLRVRLVGNGITVNRMAIGSKVRFTIPGKTLIRQVEAGTGEGNMNELTLHFGLGVHHLPLDLEVIWNTTSGPVVQLVDDVTVNQRITVLQP